jgi:copper(I)-binding protein
MTRESVVRIWRKTFASCCSLMVVAACSAPADTRELAALSVSEAWARPADSGAATAIYFVLRNASAVPDTIVGVASDEAENTSMHIAMQQGRTMTMSPISALRVPADDSVSFRPLGAHLMLTQLHRPLAAGDTVRATLTFESGQTLEVRAGVRAP